MKTVVFQAHPEGMSDAGPAECAGVVYNASRVILLSVCFYSLYLLTALTLPSPKGAGRIQSLRAFRRTGLIYAMMQWCNGSIVRWCTGTAVIQLLGHLGRLWDQFS